MTLMAFGEAAQLKNSKEWDQHKQFLLEREKQIKSANKAVEDDKQITSANKGVGGRASREDSSRKMHGMQRRRYKVAKVATTKVPVEIFGYNVSMRHLTRIGRDNKPQLRSKDGLPTEARKPTCTKLRIPPIGPCACGARKHRCGIVEPTIAEG